MLAAESKAMKRQSKRKRNAAQGAEHTPPPMDSGIHDELLDFVNRRKAEGGAPTDF